MTQSLERHNASYVVRNLSDGSKHITFVDPFSGSYLSPYRVPMSIEAQPQLRDGLDYLRNRDDELKLTIYAAPHGDRSIHDMRELEQAFQTHDAIFLEGIGHTQQQRDLVWNVSAGNKSTLTKEECRTVGPYIQRKLAVLLGMNIPVYFADIPGDGGDFEKAYLEWDGTVDILKNMIGDIRVDPARISLAMSIHLVATTIIREWYMLATIGHELKSLHDVGYSSENPMFLVGTKHGRTLPHKANVLNLATLVVEPTMVEAGVIRDITIPFDFSQAVGACAITVTP